MSKEKEPLTTEEIEKKKRTKVITVLIGTVVGGILLSSAYTIYNFWEISKKMSRVNANSQSKNSAIVKEQEIQKGWKEITEERISDLEDNQRKIVETLNKIQKNQEELHSKLQEIESELSKIHIANNSFSYSNRIHKETQPKKAENLPKESLKEIAPPPKTYTETKRNSFNEKLRETSPTERKQPELIKFTPTESENTSQLEENPQKPKLKVPVGFVRGITLTGLDAPTFQWGINNPHPILISIEDREILANNKKFNIKSCFVLGSGYGEVSSERAYIRLVKISCLTKDNKLIEQKVKGWVVDDDGKIGLKGRLVTKQGAYLAKSLVAGFLSGIAKILQAGASTISVSPLGATATINSSQATKAGIFSGTANAMDRLAAFYEKMAEQIFPVIEITPGRKVAILFEGGDNLGKAKLINLNPLGEK